MQTNEITSLNQLQVELVRNGFGKNVNDNPTDEEDIVPSPGHFAVNYITVPVSMDWGFEPRTEIIIAPNKVSHLLEKYFGKAPLSWDNKFFLSAIGWPTVESLVNPDLDFQFEKWTWGYGKDVEPNYPSGKITSWCFYDLVTKNTFEGDFEFKFQLDNFEESLVDFYCANCLTDLRKK